MGWWILIAFIVGIVIGISGTLLYFVRQTK